MHRTPASPVFASPSSAALPSPPSKPERYSHQPPPTPTLSCISIDLIFDYSPTTSEQTPREVESSSAAVTFQRLCFGLRRSDGVSKNIIRLSQRRRSAAGVRLCLSASSPISLALLFLFRFTRTQFLLGSLRICIFPHAVLSCWLASGYNWDLWDQWGYKEGKEYIT